MLLEDPETFLDPLFVKVPLHSLFVRFFFFAPPSSAVFSCPCFSPGNMLQDELRKSEEIFSGFFKPGNIGMAVSTADHQFVQMNRKLCRMLGYEKVELLGKNRMEITHPDDAASDQARLEALVSEETVHYEIDKRLIRKDGEIIFFSPDGFGHPEAGRLGGQGSCDASGHHRAEAGRGISPEERGKNGKIYWRIFNI